MALANRLYSTSLVYSVPLEGFSLGLPSLFFEHRFCPEILSWHVAKIQTLLSISLAYSEP